MDICTFLCRKSIPGGYCIHAIIASGRVRLSSDGGAKIVRYALLSVSEWKAISRYPTTASSQRRRLGGVPCFEVGPMASTIPTRAPGLSAGARL